MKNMNNSKQVREELEVLFAYLTTTVLIWIYLQDTIVDLTKDDPTNNALLPLSFIHYSVFCIGMLCLFTFYITTLTKIGFHFIVTKKINELYVFLIRLLYLWWFPVIFSATVSYVAFLFYSFSMEDTKFIFISPVVLVLILIVYYRLGIIEIHLSRLNVFKIFATIGAFIAGFWLYVLFVSGVSASVYLDTDKDIYIENDTLYLFVKPKGYIFNPYIKEIVFNQIDTITKESSDDQYKIILNKRNSIWDNYVVVNYCPQVFAVKRYKLKNLKVLH